MVLSQSLLFILATGDASSRGDTREQPNDNGK